MAHFNLAFKKDQNKKGDEVNTYYPSSSKNFATTFGGMPPSKSSLIALGKVSNANTSAGQCNWPHLIQITFPALNLLSEDEFAIFFDDHVPVDY